MNCGTCHGDCYSREECLRNQLSEKSRRVDELETALVGVKNEREELHEDACRWAKEAGGLAAKLSTKESELANAKALIRELEKLQKAYWDKKEEAEAKLKELDEKYTKTLLDGRENVEYFTKKLSAKESELAEVRKLLPVQSELIGQLDREKFALVDKIAALESSAARYKEALEESDLKLVKALAAERYFSEVADYFMSEYKKAKIGVLPGEFKSFLYRIRGKSGEFIEAFTENLVKKLEALSSPAPVEEKGLNPLAAIVRAEEFEKEPGEDELESSCTCRLRGPCNHCVSEDQEKSLPPGEVEADEEKPVPIGKCKTCGADAYTDVGFCGACGSR